MKASVRVLLTAAALGLTAPLLSSPPPASADTPFGGFAASAEAAVVRVAIYEPALPIPTTPQIDASVGYARSSTSTGPTSRALASYLWPGDTLGDGLGTLFGNESLDYPVKVNSKYPASESAPAQNVAQITDGNGMVTSASSDTTDATVTGLTVGGNLVSGIGKGLCSLLKQKCPGQDAGAPLPLPIATVASMDALRSNGRVKVGDKVVSTAQARATGISVLGGLITIDGLKLDATATSEGSAATADSDLAVTGLTVAGKKIALADPGSDDPDGTSSVLPAALSDALGIKIAYLTRSRSVDGASGKLSAAGLTITVDAAVLGKQLKLGMLSDLLAPLIGDLPQIGPLVTGLLKFGTKIVITVGDVRVAATATKAYVGPAPTTPGDNPTPGVASPPIAAPPIGGIDLPVVGEPAQIPASPEVTPREVPQNARFTFPGLTQMPSLLLLGALALLALAGQLFRSFGAFFLAADDCDLGAGVGVPNLREG